MTVVSGDVPVSVHHVPTTVSGSVGVCSPILDRAVPGRVVGTFALVFLLMSVPAYGFRAPEFEGIRTDTEDAEGVVRSEQNSESAGPQTNRTSDTPPRNFLTSLHFRGLMLVLGSIMVMFVIRRWFPRWYRVLRIYSIRWSGLAIVALGLLVLAFGSYGFSQKVNNDETVRSFLVALYETFQIFAFNVPPEDLDTLSLQLAAALAMVLAVTVASKGILFLFHDSWEKLQMLNVAGHIVVCGLGRIGRQLISDLIENHDPRLIVVIEPDEENPNLKWAREHGILSFVGDATRRDNLMQAVVRRAEEVFLVTGRDECNIECVVEIRDILRVQGRRTSWFGTELKPLKCYVHIMDRDLVIALRDHAGALEQGLLDVEVFNALERTSRRLLGEIVISSFDSKPMRPVVERDVAHFVMLGFGEFGQTLALQLAESAQFENCNRLRLSVADHDIEKTAKKFIAKNPRFGPDFGEISEWNFDETADDWASKRYRPIERVRLPDDLPGIEYACNVQYLEYQEATDDTFLNAMNAAFETDNVKPVILVCFEDDRRNFALAERLNAKLKTMDKKWPIFVWIPRQRELSQLLSEQHGTSTGNSAAAKTSCELFPFGQCYGSVSYAEVTNSWTDWLARLTHLIWMSPKEPAYDEHIASLQRAIGSASLRQAFDDLNWEKIDASAQRVWLNVEEPFRASNRSAATHAVLKAAALGCQITGVAKKKQMQPTALKIDAALEKKLREMEHYRWVAERLIAGWRYFPENSGPRKTRWQITAWDHLKPQLHGLKPKVGEDGKIQEPKDEQFKDQQIVALLIGLLLSGKLKYV